MSPWLELAAFAGVMVLGQFSPGPDMVLVTRTALAQGTRAGVLTACGIATGLAVHAAVAVGGLALTLERNDGARQWFSWAAAVYLLWLAWRIGIEHFVAGYSGAREREPAAVEGGAAYRRGLICNLLNPKLVLFLAAVTTPFLKAGREAWWPWALWAVVVGQGFLLWCLWARVLQWRPLREGYRRASRWLDLAFGLALVVLAGLLVSG